MSAHSYWSIWCVRFISHPRGLSAAFGGNGCRFLGYWIDIVLPHQCSKPLCRSFLRVSSFQSKQYFRVIYVCDWGILCHAALLWFQKAKSCDENQQMEITNYSCTGIRTAFRYHAVTLGGTLCCVRFEWVWLCPETDGALSFALPRTSEPLSAD